jgi:hypothetical protein
MGMETLGRSGQEKQAQQVNSRRGGGENTMECIGKWSICTLEVPNDKSTLTPNHLLVQVCRVIYYKEFNSIRYRLCSKDGILKGIYGREQLTPAPQHTARGLGIFYQRLDRKKL